MMEVKQIEMEQGIAAGSVNSVTPNNPQIEDWGDNGTVGENGIEL